MNHKLNALALAAAGFPTLAALSRARTRDHQTFDTALLPTGAITVHGDQRGQQLGGNFTTHDGKTVDSTGAFLVGELERLDLTLNLPLSAVTYGRDIDLREDVTLADDNSSFTQTAFGSAGSLGTGNGIRNGKAWIGKATDQIGGVGVDIGKTVFPLIPWALEVAYTIIELASAAKVGRPIDDQKIEVVKLKHAMDADEQVYVGDSTFNVGGLLNNSLVTNIANVPNGAGASPRWALKTPAEILADFNEILTSAWTMSAWAAMPNRVLIPPAQFGYLSTALISTAGNQSILKYVQDNNIITLSGRGRLEILPAKWCVGAGSGGTIGTLGTVDRMVAYTKDKKFVRFPMVPLARTPVQFESIYQKFTYYGRLGVVEVVYPETIAYRDGI